nr:hypothetical protein [Tanacetum cinerariifolium]
MLGRSFRGEDTRKTFVDHLYKALEQRHIRTYKDDVTLARGESVGPALLKAIEESHHAIIIFSKNYANSSWCLDELVYIMKCRAENGHIVMPIFYDVDPSDAAVIQIIVDAISDKLISSNYSNIDEELVGMTDPVKDLILRLEIGKGGVRMVGIWGVGGGGKTTLATSVYMEIKDRSQGHCIVDNIRDESSKHSLKTLQDKILSSLLKTQVVVQSEEEGKRLMKNRLRHSNVLILLDDVDDSKQLEALAGPHSWFGDGSRIIITTRNEHLLQKVDYVSPVRLLSQDEGNRLFKKQAYNDKKPLKDYWELSLHVVSYADGLPLALKILGSFLYDKDEKEWMSTLARLKYIPESEIVEKLKLSYDGLKTVEKELFLDVACFFRGRRREGEHHDNPEKHCRVWEKEEINMCIGDATTENDKIEVMGYQQRPSVIPSNFFKFVTKLKKLRWIHVTTSIDNNVEGPNFLSNELRYIYWQNYPASPFPDSFQPMNLVVLKMRFSLQTELWRSHKRLPQLKVLMKKLVSTPNFDGLRCLQELELIQCSDLEEIHPSIGNHRSLKKVLVSRCPNLRMFPTILKMEKLERLEIDSCHKSLEFPEIQANMESLEGLSLNEIGIEGLLSSIGERCSSLISLHLVNCFIIRSIEIDFDVLKHLKDFRIHGSTLPGKMPLDLFTEKVFPQLTHRLQMLDLVGCCLEDGEIPSAIGEMSNLQELNLEGNNFSKLHFSISQLTRLKLLILSHCKRLLELPQLPSSIGLEIPKGFTPCLRDGSSKCTLQLPENWCSDFCGFLICAVLRNDCKSKFTIYPTMTMEQVMTGGSMGMDSEDDDVIWKESVGDEITWCGGSGPTETSTGSSRISDRKDDYTPRFKIVHDSKNYLDIGP